ncbi:MAG TPA: PTS sugar transporter subunit IIC [Gemmatimonadales bacterium]
MTPLAVALTLAAGTVVGVDLASLPQAMFSRPLVAGLLGGLATGHPLPGIAIGAMLELFAMDTLPVGAARTPDWGPGTVAVGALAGASTLPASGLLGLALVAVLSAWIGGGLSQVVRRANTGAVEARRAALESGDSAVLRSLQWMGLLRDALRGLVLTAIALLAGMLVSSLFSRTWVGPQLLASVALAATSAGVALFAGLRLSGVGRERLWVVGGFAAGLALAVVWLK